MTVLPRLLLKLLRRECRTLPSKAAALTVAAFAAVSPADALADLSNTYNRADWLTAQTDAVDASRNATLSYDLAGNLTTKTRATGTRTFAWDARGALASVSESESGTELGRYDYDASGMRVKRATGSEAVEYVLDDGHVLQEADGAAPAHPGYRRYHYGYGPLSVTDTNGKRFIQTDALGSPTDLTSTSGAIASVRKYDAWGSYRNDSAPTAADEKLGYTGHQYDPETGLVYARARYYDPEVGEFISRDSYEGKTEDSPSLHRFAYAQANPLRYTDPTGHLQNEAQIQDQMDKAWETYHAAEEGSPERAQALQRYQYWRDSLSSSQDNKLFGEMIMFPAAKGTIIGSVLGPFAWGRALLGVLGIAGGVQKLDEAREKTGMQRSMAISEGLGMVLGGGLLYRSGVAEIRAPSSAAQATATVVEGEGAAVGEASTVKVAEPQVGAARGGPPLLPRPQRPRQQRAPSTLTATAWRFPRNRGASSAAPQ